MKISFSSKEVLQILADHVQSSMQSGTKWACDNDYVYFSDLTFVEVTPEYLAAKEQEARNLEKYRAEDAAKKAAAEVVEAAGRG